MTDTTRKRLRKVVFPAAGLGTRFLPATKALPKEMMPLVDKPVIQYGVEEAVASGCDEIIIVTGRGKGAMEDHFDISYELEKTLEERGKKECLRILCDRWRDFGSFTHCFWGIPRKLDPFLVLVLFYYAAGYVG